jgi:hypothetical protein
LEIFIDCGEPSCWACGFHYGTKYDIQRPDAAWNKILKAWNAIPLQRCHIRPRSLGGTDEPDNLFLMCRECHDLAPNTDIPQIFFDWVRAQNSWIREGRKLEAAFEAFDVNDLDKDELLVVMRSEEFRLWCGGRVGIHRPQSNYGTALARLTPATLVGLVCHYARKVRASDVNG